MCGIFGIVLREGALVSHAVVAGLLAKLYELSESRGKESAGLHVYLPRAARAWTLKGAQRATDLLRSREYANLVDGELRSAMTSASGPRNPVVILAHSRLVTNGPAELPQNNQPVRVAQVTMIHNGICVNVEELWASHPNLRRSAEVDTEVMAALIDAAVRGGATPADATRGMYAQLKGAASIAWVHDGADEVVLATNTGDLYFSDLTDQGYLAFASERYILETALARSDGTAAAEWLPPGHGLIVGTTSVSALQRFVFDGPVSESDAARPDPARRVASVHVDLVCGVARAGLVSSYSADETLLRYRESSLRELRRCSRCVLPETFPFIEFDDVGVCNYCRSYRPRYANMHPVETRREFIRSLERYRRRNGEPDAIVAFSGGRDSSYGLHLIKKEFGLTPITFTYDWGMVTDLARRNVARICGQLGIQNILVSADIAQKRDNIRRNVAAWLRKPDLGLVPLFMAGDKHFFKVVNQLKRQTGISLDLWCANPLENTDFKAGFCGVAPDFDKKRVDYLSLGRKVRLAAYYGLSFIRNPGYLNRSLADTAGAFMAYYVEPRRDFYFIFDHFVWEEKEVNDVLLSEYEWELAPDTTSTWRIGDGTAPFYNYIYVTARGFSEFDTFRSNQIREGHISRDEALASVLSENRPRAQSLRWYLETIGLDFDTTIRRINELDTLGLHR